MKIIAPKLHKKQGEVAKSILQSPPKSRHILCTSRQWGKSQLISILALNYLTNESNIRIGYFTRYRSLAKKIMKEMFNLVSETKRYEMNISDLEIKRGNSQIKFFGTENSVGIRGFTFDYIFIDEGAFIDDDIFYSIIGPTFNVKGKQMIIVSTPTTEDTWFYKEYTSDNNFSYWSNYKENPFADIELIEREKENMPIAKFRCEYLAEFTTNGLGVFTNIDDVCILQEARSEKAVAGLDIGLKNDYTVLSVFDKYEAKQIQLIRFTGLDSNDWVDKIISAIKEFNIVEIKAEVNFESTLIKLLKERIRKDNINTCFVKEEITSNKSKIKLIEQFIAACDYKKIQLLDNKEQKSEMGNMVKKQTQSSYTYNATKGHDDIVMATAYAYDHFCDKASPKVIKFTNKNKDNLW